MIIQHNAPIIVLLETTPAQLELLKLVLDEQGQLHNELFQEAENKCQADVRADLQPYTDMFQNVCADLNIPGWEV